MKTTINLHFPPPNPGRPLPSILAAPSPSLPHP
ncbi:hypothetical protein E2C01_089720 [Portunus trituberculatus]|uniref:Uncharacterized protein n=1 Tax=Portunus trituberculatus TaxID=210409 RepID=A0A5B7JJV7_PORTR|nr:hypothetical protein [Portunus trituberculatus]